MKPETIKKISQYSSVPEDMIFSFYDMENFIYFPLLLEKQEFGDKLLKMLDIIPKPVNTSLPPLSFWRKLCKNFKIKKEKVRILMIGKYGATQDTYLSVRWALIHSCNEANLELDLKYLNAEDLDDTQNETYNYGVKMIKDADGVIIPGGFGYRGIDGLINSMKIIIKGICLIQLRK